MTFSDGIPALPNDGKMRESSILTPSETISWLDLEGPKGMWIGGRKKIGDLGALGT